MPDRGGASPNYDETGNCSGQGAPRSPRRMPAGYDHHRGFIFAEFSSHKGAHAALKRLGDPNSMAVRALSERSQSLRVDW